MNQARQREKAVRWTRSIFFDHEDDEPDHLFFDFAAVILAHTPHLTELIIETGIVSNSMFAIVSATAGGSLRDLRLTFGADFAVIIGHIGRLPMLRSLTLETYEKRPIIWDALPMDMIDPWKLPLLNTLHLLQSEVPIPSTLFSFFSRCDLDGLTEFKIRLSTDLSPDATQALSKLLRNLPDLTLFDFKGRRATLDTLLPDVSCRSLHINRMPSAPMAASLSARMRTILVVGLVVKDTNERNPTAEDIRDFLRAVNLNRPAQSELIRIQLKLDVRVDVRRPSPFLWHSDVPSLATFLGTILSPSLRLRDQGVVVADYEDRSMDE
jgi:hypothetical protein